MNFANGKLFFNRDYRVDFFEIDQSNNYYKSVREKVDNGYKPIIVSSDLMIDILKKYFKEKKANVVNIELLQEDHNYQEQINKLISSLKTNRDYFIDLVEELSFLSETNNNEIRRLRFKYRKGEELIDISISLNGLLNYSDNQATKEELKGITAAISGYLEWLYKNND